MEVCAGMVEDSIDCGLAESFGIVTRVIVPVFTKVTVFPPETDTVLVTSTALRATE